MLHFHVVPLPLKFVTKGKNTTIILLGIREKTRVWKKYVDAMRGENKFASLGIILKQRVSNGGQK